MRFLALDFETATAKRDSACAVGIAAVDGGRIVSSASYLIRPPGNRYDPFNITVHGIIPTMTAGARPFRTVMAAVLEMADGLPLVAHNASFDMSVLRAGFESCGHRYPQLDYYCTLVMARASLPELPDHKLPNVLRALGGTMTNHHDPKADAEACAEIVLALARLEGAARIEELAECLGMQVGRLHDRGYQPCRGAWRRPPRGA